VEQAEEGSEDPPLVIALYRWARTANGVNGDEHLGALRQFETRKIGDDAICLVAIARVSQSTYLNFREAAQTTPVGPSRW